MNDERFHLLSLLSPWITHYYLPARVVPPSRYAINPLSLCMVCIVCGWLRGRRKYSEMDTLTCNLGLKALTPFALLFKGELDLLNFLRAFET